MRLGSVEFLHGLKFNFKCHVDAANDEKLVAANDEKVFANDEEIRTKWLFFGFY